MTDEEPSINSQPFWRPRAWKPGWILPSVLILLSVLTIVLPRYWPSGEVPSVEAGTEESVSDFSLPSQLQLVMEIQGKMVVGSSTLNPVQAVQLVDQLSAEVKGTPRAEVLVELLRLYLSGEDDRSQLLEGLSGFEDPLAEEIRLSFAESAPPNPGTLMELGWFGDLWENALLPLDDPARKSFAGQGTKLMMMVGGLMMLAVGLVLVGVGLSIGAIVAFVTKWLTFLMPASAVERSNGPKAAWVFLEAFAVYLLTMVLFSLFGGWLDPFLGGFSQGLLVVPFLLGLFWPMIRGLSMKQVFRDIGWHRGRGIFREIGAGIIGYLALLPLFICGFIITALLIHLTAGDEGALTNGPSHPITDMFDGTGWQAWATAFVLAAVCAPLFEETLFRGYFYRALRSRWGIILSALVMGVIFAVVHPQGLVAVPALAGLGAGFGLLREWRDSLIAPMTAHALHNGTIVLMLILFMGGGAKKSPIEEQETFEGSPVPVIAP